MRSIDIVTRSKEILYDLGCVYRTDDMWDYYGDVIQTCSYSGYGLKIVAYDLPAIVFEDKTTGKLIPGIKKYMNKISIYYKDTIMFDSGRNIYKSGIWEEILDELYIKLPVLRQKIDDWHQKELHCNEFMEKCFLPLYRRGIRTIIGKIKIGYKTVTTAEINNCGSYIDEHYYYVEVNNKQVLYVVVSSKL